MNEDLITNGDRADVALQLMEELLKQLARSGALDADAIDTIFARPMEAWAGNEPISSHLHDQRRILFSIADHRSEAEQSESETHGE